MKNTKKVLSLLLSLVMVVSTFAFVLPILKTEAEAAYTQVYFYVPECVYKSPTSSTAVQWYLNSYQTKDNQSWASAKESVGKLYFYCAGATSVTLSYSGCTPTNLTTTGTTTINDDSFTFTTSSSLITWTATYVVDGVTKTVTSYTYAYTPYRYPMGASSENESAKHSGRKYDYLGTVTALWGCNSVSTVYVTGVPYSTGASDRMLLGASGSMVTGSNSRPHNCGYFNSSAPHTFLYHNNDNINTTCDNGNLEGHFYIDTSRFTNINTIPNFSYGLASTDDQHTDYHEYQVYLQRRDGTQLQYARYVKLTTETVVYQQGANPFSYAINSDISTGATKDYRIYTYGRSYCGGTVTHTYLYIYFDIHNSNKSTLRSTYLNELYKSYHRQASNYTSASWNTYANAMKNAATVLGNPTATYSQASSAVTTLNDAVNGLQTNVYINGNGGSISGGTSFVVTIGGAFSMTYTPTSTASRSGYSFLGWNKSSTATTYSGSVTISFNNTLYAIWSKDVYATYVYLDEGGNRGVQTFSSIGKDAINGYTLPVTGNCSPNAQIDGKTYTFIGWREDTTAATPTFGTDLSSVFVSPWSSRTFYAIYSGTLSFVEDLNGAVNLDLGPANVADVVKTATQYVNSENIATNRTSTTFYTDALNLYREGFQFIGWSDIKETEDIMYEKGTPIKISSDKRIYATFTVAKFDAKFYDYDGTFLGESNKIWFNKNDPLDPTKSRPMGTYDPATGAYYFATAPLITTSLYHHVDNNYHYQFLTWESTDSKNAIRFVNDENYFRGYVEYLTEDINVYAKYKAIAHIWETIDGTTVNATCTEAGRYDRRCIICNHVQSGVPIPAKGHVMVRNEGAKAPTCEAGGCTGVSYCSVCNWVESENTALPAIGHDYEAEVVPATCTSRGYTLYTCKNNSAHTYKDNYTELKPHTYEVASDGVAPTCTTDGHSSWARCTVCGSVEEGEQILPAYGHDIVKHDRVEATCLTDGNIEYYECLRCGALFTDAVGTVSVSAEDVVIKSNGAHVMLVVPAVEAGCETPGNTAGNYCTVCGEGVVPEVIPATGHDFENAEQIVTKPASCIETGTAQSVCNNCEMLVEIVLPLTDHVSEIVPERAPTCALFGETAYEKCSVCGERLTESYSIDKLAHEFTVVVTPEVPATCESVGMSAVMACANCGAHSQAVYKAALGHSYGDMVTIKAPTCDTLGLRARYCSNPGCTSVADEYVIDCTGHHYTDLPDTPATCEQEGITGGSQCVICGAWEAGKTPTVIPALGHDIVTNVVASTCVLEGYTRNSCTRCDYYYDTAYQPKSGHTGGEATCTKRAVCTVCHKAYGELLPHNYTVEVTQAATCTLPDILTYTCTECGSSYVYTGEPGGHKFDEAYMTIVPATCTTDGIMSVPCKNCDAVEETILPATGHDYQWTASVDGSATGVCANCGDEQTSTAAEVGIETPACERCGYHHTRNNFFFKYGGVYCIIKGFFNKIIALFSK